MAQTTFKLTGFKELSAALADLPKTASRAAVRRALIKAGTPTQEMAQRNAPVRQDPESVVTFGPEGAKKIRRPGTAKALVEIGTRLTKTQARQARKAGKSEVEVHIGTRDPISRLQELGTAAAAAHPFMRPAWDATKDGVIPILAQELGPEIDRAVARLAKKLARAAK